MFRSLRQDIAREWEHPNHGKKKWLSVKASVFKNFTFVLDVGLPHVKVEDIQDNESMLHSNNENDK